MIDQAARTLQPLFYLEGARHTLTEVNKMEKSGGDVVIGFKKEYNDN